MGNNRLEIARKELLDLGLRNSLINHRQRAKQVKVVDERSRETFRILVAEGRKMSFDPMPDAKVKELAAKDGTGLPEEPEDSSVHITQPEENTSDLPALRHIDLQLQTALSSEALQKRLLSIHNDARGYVQEQGVNILFLALGFLHWYESDSAEEPRRAPLVLVPIELERTSARERFRVAYSGEELGDNLSLAAKIKAEFGVDLPSLGDAESLDVEQFFASVRSAVAGHSRWEVKPDEMTLGFFSFGKFLMYRDLDPTSWPEEGGPADHDVLSALLTDGFCEPSSDYGDEDHIDQVVAPRDVHQVMDADSSQILAILDVNAGRNLVLQGPPGTGKSQTITNIIAECVGNGRKVLFVSEKMAALEVVKRRLDKIGLGEAVLELHSHKTKKRETLRELERTLNQGRPQVQDSSDDIETLTRLRDQLNTYCDAVNEPIGKTRTNFVNALGHSANAKPDDSGHPPFPFAKMSSWSDSDFREARRQVEVLDRHLADAGAPNRNPFRGSRLAEYFPAHGDKIKASITACMHTTEELAQHGYAVADLMSLPRPETWQDLQEVCRTARVALSAPDVRDVRLTHPAWGERREQLARVLEAGRQLAIAHGELDEVVIDQAWEADLVEIRQQFVSKGDKWWRVFSGAFRRAKAAMQGYLRDPMPETSGAVVDIIGVILDSQKDQASFADFRTLGESVFGTRWREEASDWNALEEVSRWASEASQDVRNGKLPPELLQFLEAGSLPPNLGARVEALENLLRAQEESCAALAQDLRLSLPEGKRSSWGLTVDKQHALLRAWSAKFDRLQHLARFNQLSAELVANGLGFVAEAGRAWEASPGALTELFEFSWYIGLVETAYSERPSLRAFDRREHSHALEEFSRLDRLLFRHNRLRLILEHWKRLPSLNDGGQLGVIRHEINKKRGHMPIRVLMEKAGHAVQAIKPVFMMGPMSVAKYLAPGALQFDLVVFDEASQVKPVDAFGAIRRGKQTVVVGDSKQLPPTSFFDSVVEGEEEDYDALGDVESILSLFLARGAPERMLRWHYRSQHESLIAVSNHEFYDNRLVVFPSPGINPLASGLRLRHQPKNAYGRGTSSTNVGEAEEIARAVMKHARELPDLSLGVVAFSVAQRDAILFQLEQLRNQDPTCEEFFQRSGTEEFFVKNLESVQGDERDTIFISVGYGRNEQGYMGMSFGPLNRQGGERRLNVLISRARKAMEVFSNFTAADMDLARSNARGVHALKTFLAYAETGIIQQPQSTGREPDSPFEEAVIKELRQRGYQIEPQVGTAGFFIDLAVKDPDKPGRYLLGVECDGATYHSSRSARDRDRLRQEVLESLGWRLHRIWSTSWYKNRELEMGKLVQAIESAREYFASVSTSASGVRRSSMPVVLREEGSKQDRPSAAMRYPEYERCSLDIDLYDRALHEVSSTELAVYVQTVVDAEYPIHSLEVTRRITEGAGLKRTGGRIKQAVDNAINFADHTGIVELRGDFLWKSGANDVTVRDRSSLDNTQKKFDMIAPEEIAEALKCEVTRGFSLAANDAITAAGRALGFQRITSGVSATIDRELQRLVDDGVLTRAGDQVRAA